MQVSELWDIQCPNCHSYWLEVIPIDCFECCECGYSFQLSEIDEYSEDDEED